MHAAYGLNPSVRPPLLPPHRPLAEQLGIRLIAKQSIATVAGGFYQHAQLHPLRDQIVGGGVSGTGEFLHFGDRDNRALV